LKKSPGFSFYLYSLILSNSLNSLKAVDSGNHSPGAILLPTTDDSGLNRGVLSIKDQVATLLIPKRKKNTYPNAFKETLSLYP